MVIESKNIIPSPSKDKKNLINFNISKDIENISNLIVCDPLSYNEFLLQVCNASFVITDSGGIRGNFLPWNTLFYNQEKY